jgi:hypothetical protein
LQSPDAFLKNATPSLPVHVLSRVARQAGRYLHIVLRQKCRHTFVSGFKQHGQIASINNPASGLPPFQDQASKILVQLRRTPCDINHLYVRRTPKKLNDPARHWLGHLFRALRSRINMAMVAGLVAYLPYVDLQSRNCSAIEHGESMGVECLPKIQPGIGIDLSKRQINAPSISEGP